MTGIELSHSMPTMRRPESKPSGANPVARMRAATTIAAPRSNKAMTNKHEPHQARRALGRTLTQYIEQLPSNKLNRVVRKTENSSIIDTRRFLLERGRA